MRVDIQLGAQAFHVELEETSDGWRATVDGHTFPVTANHAGPGAAVQAGQDLFMIQTDGADAVIVNGHRMRVRLEHLHGVAGIAQDHGAGGAIKPPMTGRIDDILVKPEQAVKRGDVLFVLEAMKMRNEVRAPIDGIVESVNVAAGANVDPATTILTLGPR